MLDGWKKHMLWIAVVLLLIVMWNSNICSACEGRKESIRGFFRGLL